MGAKLVAMPSSSSLRWVDRSQPQTLMSATIIMYINAVFSLTGLAFWILDGFPAGLLLLVGQVAGGLGVANEKKWGYWTGVVTVALFVAYLVLHLSFASIIYLLFYGALLALLLHPQSRAYKRTWFRW